MYSGFWKKGLPNGKGTIITKEFDFEGNWLDGNPDGYCKITFVNGDKYRGEFKAGEPIGEAIITLADGTTQEGYWQSGQFVVDESDQNLENAAAQPVSTALHLSSDPVVVNNRTYVPLRDLFQALGAKVDWEESTRTVTVNRGGNTIKLIIGQLKAESNGQSKLLEAAPFVKNNTPFVPLRFAAEALGEEVSFDQASGKINFGKYYFYLKQTKPQETAKPKPQPSQSQTGPSDDGDAAQKLKNRFVNKLITNSYSFNSRSWINVRPYLPY